ncbi:MAG TPA: helicase, partial [Candidatus Caccousia stercoris]|nr:helicase [Candidatus Caccousia stercoris]
MLKLVLGRSGSGKTTTLRELVRQSLREDRERPVFLIVPEQASFENERAMLSLLGAEDAQLVHVLSFSRLADEAFRLYGGGAGRRLDDGGRSMFMSLALSAVQDRLDFYRRSAAGGELVSLMLA